MDATVCVCVCVYLTCLTSGLVRLLLHLSYSFSYAALLKGWWPRPPHCDLCCGIFLLPAVSVYSTGKFRLFQYQYVFRQFKKRKINSRPHTCCAYHIPNSVIKQLIHNLLIYLRFIEYTLLKLQITINKNRVFYVKEIRGRQLRFASVKLSFAQNIGTFTE